MYLVRPESPVIVVLRTWLGIRPGCETLVLGYETLWCVFFPSY